MIQWDSHLGRTCLTQHRAPFDFRTTFYKYLKMSHDLSQAKLKCICWRGEGVGWLYDDIDGVRKGDA